MGFDVISDSEDDAWLSPWPSTAQSKDALAESVLHQGVRTRSNSISSDELATTYIPRAPRAPPEIFPPILPDACISEVPTDCEQHDAVEKHDALAHTTFSPHGLLEVEGSRNREAEVQPDAIIPKATPISGRSLRPRTYRQLHTYEYEHAKYVLECRAAGIKPVRFDGTRYREMDNLDDDYLPESQDTHADAGDEVDQNIVPTFAEPGASELAGTVESPRRKRRNHLTKFRDPRDLATQQLVLEDKMTKNFKGATDLFDFPDQHWQRESDPLSFQMSSGSDISAADDFILNEHDLFAEDGPADSDASDTSLPQEQSEEDGAERARFARKLKGILPPSFLSRNAYADKQSGKTIEKRRRPAEAGKGIAKKKFNSSIANPVFRDDSFASDEDRMARSEVLQDRQQSITQKDKTTFENGIIVAISSGEETNDDEEEADDVDDIIEVEETFDRMLPQRKRRKVMQAFKYTQMVKDRGIADISVSLQKVIAKLPSFHSRDLRIARRTLVHRKHGLSTRRIRQPIKQHKPLLTSGSRQSEPVAGSSTKQDGPYPSYQLLNGSPSESLKAGQSDEHVRPRSSSLSQEPLRISTQRPRSAQPLTGESSSTIASSHFEAPAYVEQHHSDVQDPRVQGAASISHHVPMASKLVSRTFVTGIEHQAGHRTLQQRSVRVRPKKQPYLRSFKEITDLFDKGDDHLKKVSAWQEKTIPRDPQHRGNNKSSTKLFSLNKVRRKPLPLHRSVKQSSMGDYTSRVMKEATRDQSMPNLRCLQFDPFLGCSPNADGPQFDTRTFVGGHGLVGLFMNNEVGTLKGCYIASKQMLNSENFQECLDFGFSILNDKWSTLSIDDTSLFPDDLEIYDFLRFVASANEVDKLWLLYDRLCSAIIRNQNTRPSLSRQSRLRHWCNIFILIVLHKLTKHQQAYVTIEDLDREINHVLETLTDDCFGSLPNNNNPNQGVGSEILNDQSKSREALLECWTILFHIANASITPFWHRLNQYLTIARKHEIAAAERAWTSIFQLAHVCAINIYGDYKKSQAIPNWEGVEMLFQNIITEYDQGDTSEAHLIEAYLNLLLRRVHGLVVSWCWPQSSLLLGHGRSGGVLYEFFLKDLQLRAFPSEHCTVIDFPRFLRVWENPQYLQLEADDVKNSFGIFLKLVVLGLRQYISGLDCDLISLERLRKRGLGVVDKFATLGKLNYAATDSIDRAAVIEIQNRYSLEVAVYWAAAQWKDRGLQKLIQASIEAMPGSHLVLRTMQIHAWEIVTRLQLSRSEDGALDVSAQWLIANVQATVSDVLQFRHQARLQSCDAKDQSRIDKNLKQCHELLIRAFESYRSVLELQHALTTSKRMCLLWMNDILKPVLQLHESFVMQSNPTLLITKVFDVVNLLIRRHVDMDVSTGSQEFDLIDFSQEDCNVIDYDKLSQDRCETLLNLLFRFLTDLTSQEHESSRLKLLARAGLQSFSAIILHLHAKGIITWPALFDDSGSYSWKRLLDRPIKDIMLPYYLAILCEKDSSFFDTMQSLVFSVWLTSIAKLHVKDSLAALTSVLLRKPNMSLFLHDSLLYQQFLGNHNISAQQVDDNRADLLLAILRGIGQTYKSSRSTIDARRQVIELSRSLRATWETFALMKVSVKERYMLLIGQALSGLHQFCADVLKTMNEKEILDLKWLSDSTNVPQTRGNFAADTFKSFAEGDIDKRSIEIAFILLAHCDHDILENRTEFTAFLSRALTNEELSPCIAPAWHARIAVLRKHIVLKVFAVLQSLSAQNAAAHLYSMTLAKALATVYKSLAKQSWSGNPDYVLSFHHELVDILANLPRDRQSVLHSVLGALFKSLSRYSCLQGCHELRDPSPPASIHYSAHLVQALLANFEKTWKTTSPGTLYHTRRHVAVTIPASDNLIENLTEQTHDLSALGEGVILSDLIL